MRYQLAYLVKEAFRGLFYSPFLTATSFLTIGICAAVLSVLLLGMQMALSLTPERPEAGIIQAYLKDSYSSPDSIQSVEKNLARLSGIDSIHFISKDSALSEFKQDFDSEMVSFLDANPLPASFRILPAQEYQGASTNKVLLNRVLRIPGIEEASNNAMYLAWIEQWRVPSLLVAVFLFFFIVGSMAVIVRNAVKLSLYARKSLVDNMKYCGASEAFITAPFLMESLLLALAGSSVGAITAWGLKQICSLLLPGLALSGVWKWNLFLLFAITSFIACVTSFRTVRQFIRETRG